MDFSDPDQLRVFFEVHRDLPREGPGNTASTLRALELAGEQPEHAAVLDIACGPGMQTADLAGALPTAHITAVDLHEPFLVAAREHAEAAGVAERITFERADMAALPCDDSAFDLIWCEGAAYILGFEEALTNWRRLLAPGGVLALTEPVWLADRRPAELERWWQAGYPDMSSADERRAQVAACGYTLRGDFVLPESAWWDHYYTPMSDRLDTLEARHHDDPVARAVLHGCRVEIQHYRDYSASYGYLFLVMATP